MKTLGTVFLIVMLLSVFSVVAAEKVVVIPLTGTKTVTQSNFLPVYDSSDVFVGYLLPKSSDNGYTVISPTGYAMMVNEEGSDYLSWISTYYTTEICSDTPKVSVSQSNVHMLHPYPGSSKGQVFPVVTELARSLYYIPFDATTKPIVNYYQKYPNSGTCNRDIIPGPTNVYDALVNDPAVTGFQNSYNFPFKVVYTIPPAP